MATTTTKSFFVMTSMLKGHLHYFPSVTWNFSTATPRIESGSDAATDAPCGNSRGKAHAATIAANRECVNTARKSRELAARTTTAATTWTTPSRGASEYSILRIRSGSKMVFQTGRSQRRKAK